MHSVKSGAQAGRRHRELNPQREAALAVKDGEAGGSHHVLRIERSRRLGQLAPDTRTSTADQCALMPASATQWQKNARYVTYLTFGSLVCP